MPAWLRIGSHQVGEKLKQQDIADAPPWEECSLAVGGRLQRLTHWLGKAGANVIEEARRSCACPAYGCAQACKQARHHVNPTPLQLIKDIVQAWSMSGYVVIPAASTIDVVTTCSPACVAASRVMHWLRVAITA
eukprot:363429-Chlamydomonas_euryale.AAC.14